MSEKRNWLVWSHEHNGWWDGNRYGYTKSKRKAGRFSFREAKEITMGANIVNPDHPEETMLFDG